MSEYSGCSDFTDLMESYKNDDKKCAKERRLEKFLKTP